MTERTDDIQRNEVNISGSEETVELIVQVPEDLYRAYHRCCWIVHNETGRERIDLAREMVTDFLMKNGC